MISYVNHQCHHLLVALKTCSELIPAKNTLKTVLVMIYLKHHRKVEVSGKT